MQGYRVELSSTFIAIRTTKQCFKVHLLIQGLSEPGECFGQQNWTEKPPENKLSHKISVTCCFQSNWKYLGAAFRMVVLALLPPDGAQKCRSAQKSNVLGGELIKCFQTSKKEKEKEKISSGRVQVLGSSFRDPWDSFVVRPLIASLKSYPRELIDSNSVQSQHCPSLFCVVRLSKSEPRIVLHSVCWRPAWAKSQKNPAFIPRQRLSLFSTLPSTFLLKSELQMADPCTDLFFLWRWYHFKLLFHTETFKASCWHNHPPKMLTDEAGEKQARACLKTEQFQDFYLILRTFQMLSSVVDFRIDCCFSE